MTESKWVDRKCSYCEITGHTIRTCTKRKSDLDQAEQMNAKARKEIVSLMKDVGLSIGALIEIKHRDFKKVYDTSNPEDGAITEIFIVAKIRWNSVNRTMTDQHLKSSIKNYIQDRGGMKQNYANVILINPSYPDGYAITVTAEKMITLLKQKQPFSLENNIIGDFIIHDIGDWEKTESSIPKDFFKGKFYTATNKPII